jgi:hypothetical protein
MNECSHRARGKCEPCEQKGDCYYQNTKAAWHETFSSPHRYAREVPPRLDRPKDKYKGARASILLMTILSLVLACPRGLQLRVWYRRPAAPGAEQIKLTLLMDRYTPTCRAIRAFAVVTQAHRGPARADQGTGVSAVCPVNGN